MSRSVHTSRAKFRKEFRIQHSTPEIRERALGKIIDESLLKRAPKANARVKRKSRKVGAPVVPVYLEESAARSKKSAPSKLAKEIVAAHERAGYG